MKKRVGVIFGGETYVKKSSQNSAASIIKNIDKSKYDIFRIGITEENQWLEYTGPIENIENGMWENDPLYISPNGHRLIIDKELDVIFPSLNVFDRVMGLLCVDFKYTNSFINLNLSFTKYIIDKFNIKQAKYIVLTDYEWNLNKNSILEEIEKELGYNIIIKAENEFLTESVYKDFCKSKLMQEIDLLFKIHHKIILEECLSGSIIPVCLLGTSTPTAALSADLPQAIIEKLKKLAIKIFKIFDCSCIAIINFIVDINSCEIYFNNIDTTPLLTETSLYTTIWGKEGKTYPEIIDNLINFTIEKAHK